MEATETQKYLKVGVFAGLLGAAGYFILPILVTMAINMVTLALSGVLLLALWIFLPAISEVLSQSAYRLWEIAIKTDPIARLKRDLKAHADQIKNMEERIVEASAQTKLIQDMIREQAGILTEFELAEWKAQVESLKYAGAEMIKLRDDELRKHEDFKRQVAKAEANMRIGKAISSALNVFSFDKKDGAGSAGARVALDEVQKQLAESQAKLQVILTRKTAQIPVTAQTQAIGNQQQHFNPATQPFVKQGVNA